MHRRVRELWLRCCCSTLKMSGTPPPWLTEGMDPSSSYLLKIKLLGNRKKARKEIRCFSLTKVVDADTTNWKDFIESIIDEFPPRYKEVPFVQYFDAALKSYPEIRSDQDLVVMFDKHVETKVVCMFIAYYDPSDAEPQPITEWSPSSPEKEDVCAHDSVQGQIEDNVQADEEEDNYLVNPLLENEHVGIDDEGIYLDEEPTYPLAVTTVPEKENAAIGDAIFGSSSEDAISGSSSEVAISCSEDNSESSSDLQDVVADFEETEELVGKDSMPDHVSIVDYDKEDPPMKVGSIYPNIYMKDLVSDPFCDAAFIL